MQQIYCVNDTENRKLKYLYHQSGIDTRYFAVTDESENGQSSFYPSKNTDAFPDLESRMKIYKREALPLSIDAINKCIEGKINKEEITHLITVSCTGMSAPGLDLEIMEEMNLPSNIFRTSVNFMGCYAAIHALKLADALCQNDTNAKVVIVCTELCSLHFQNEATTDNLSSSLLFADGSAAALVTHDTTNLNGLRINNFYSQVAFKGKEDMSWQLSSKGFLMKLSGYIPDLLQQDFNEFTNNALQNGGCSREDISYWCIHPGGKRILNLLRQSLKIKEESLHQSYHVLQKFGNMSSPTILFVLKEIMEKLETSENKPGKIFGAAFGPGLTMESFLLTHD
jgi:Predicted naringenin-chalcone synthase